MLELRNTFGKIFNRMVMTIAVVTSERYVLKNDKLPYVNMGSNLNLQVVRRWLQNVPKNTCMIIGV